MSSKQHEIEAIVEDLIENTIFELFADSFSSAKECGFAMDVLRQKLDEIETSDFKKFFE